MGSFWGDFGPFLGRSGVTLGSLRDHFGIVLGSFWCRFDPILSLFGAFLTLLGGFLGLFRPKTCHFGGLGQKCIETLKPYFEEDT